MAQLDKDLTDYEESSDFELLPPGWYEARVADSEIKEGPKGDYINWTFEIIGHPAMVWDIMSLGNDISMRRLKSLAVCAGHSNPNYIADTEELHGKELLVKLKIEKDKTGEYADKNRISAFKPMADNKPPKPVVKPDTKDQKMPWESNEAEENNDIPF